MNGPLASLTLQSAQIRTPRRFTIAPRNNTGGGIGAPDAGGISPPVGSGTGSGVGNGMPGRSPLPPGMVGIPERWYRPNDNRPPAQRMQDVLAAVGMGGRAAAPVPRPSAVPMLRFGAIT